MTPPGQSGTLELVRDLPGGRQGQVAQVWRLPSGEFALLSTVPCTLPEMAPLDEMLGALMPAVHPGDPNAEYMAHREPGLEETMAFSCDPEAETADMAVPIAAAQGDGSRQRVLDALRAGVDWRTAPAGKENR